MKNTTRKIISTIKNGFVIVLALLCLILLSAAIITLSTIILKLFVICAVVYFGFILWETVIWPFLRKK